MGTYLVARPDHRARISSPRQDETANQARRSIRKLSSNIMRTRKEFIAMRYYDVRSQDVVKYKVEGPGVGRDCGLRHRSPARKSIDDRVTTGMKIVTTPFLMAPTK